MNTPDSPARPILAPVRQAERIHIVGILRGCPFFGILVVDVALFSRPMQSLLVAADPATPL